VRPLDVSLNVDIEALRFDLRGCDAPCAAHDSARFDVQVGDDVAVQVVGVGRGV